MKTNLTFLISATLLLVLFTLLPGMEASAQCAMCRASVESNAQTGNTDAAQNLNNGILYLMSLPYIIFATIGVLWYRRSRARKAARKTMRPGNFRPATGF